MNGTMSYVGMLCLVFTAPGGQGADAQAPREVVLFQNAGLPLDNATLIAYLDGRTATDPAKVRAAVLQLGAGRFAARQDAKTRLLAAGRPALPILREHFEDKDPEIARGAKDCAQAIDRAHAGESAFLPLAAVRLLVQRQAEGTVEALLRHLPFADAALDEEIWWSLDRLAVRDGRVHPSVTAALEDREPSRRALAACLAGRTAEAKQQEAVRRLLRDKAALVRLRAAQGLLAGKDTAGVPALIDLLGDAPLELAWQAEELLRWLAGEASAEQVLGDGTAKERAGCRGAWEQWWKKTPKVDWAALEKSSRRPGLLLVQEMTLIPPAKRGEPDAWDSRLVLYGCDGKARGRVPAPKRLGNWTWLPGSRLLSHEGERGEPNPITLWDAGGQKLWQTLLPEGVDPPVDLKPSPDGRFLVLGENALLTLDGRGRVDSRQKLEWSGRPPRLGLLGEGIFVRDEISGGYQLRTVDLSTGKDLKRVHFARDRKERLAWHYCEPTPEGRFLVPLGEVQEIDAAGRTVWRTKRANNFGWAMRLRTGNTLLMPTSFDSADPSWLLEVDSSDALVWEMPLPTSCWKVQDVSPMLRLGFGRPTGAESNLDRPSYWLAQMTSKDVVIRRRAAGRLVSLKLSNAELQIAYLHLKDSDNRVKDLFFNVLEAANGREAKTALPILIALLDDPASSSRAVVSLGRFVADAIPAILAAFKDPSSSELKRERAAYALGRWCLDRPEVTALLRNVLHEEKPKVQLAAAIGICVRGEAARPWVPEIAKLVKGKDKWLAREIMLLAFPALGSTADAAVPSIVEALEDAELRALGFHSLHLIGSRHPKALRSAPDLLPALIKFLDPKYPAEASTGAASVLRCMGEGASQAVPYIRKALTDRRPAYPRAGHSVRSVVAEALGELGVVGASAAAELLAISRNNSEATGMRINALAALGKIGPPAKEVVPGLLQLLREEAGMETSNWACLALARIDPDAARQGEAIRRTKADRPVKE